MGRLNESEFKVQIKSGEYSPAYFIYGSEGYLKQFYVDQLIKKLALQVRLRILICISMTAKRLRSAIY